MKLYIREQGRYRDVRERRMKESYYIAKYKTLSPQGMNKYAGPLSDFYETVQKNPTKENADRESPQSKLELVKIPE